MNQNYPRLPKAIGRREVLQLLSVHRANRFVPITDFNTVLPVGFQSERSIPHRHVCNYQTVQNPHPLESHPVKPGNSYFRRKENGSSSSSEPLPVISSRIKCHTSRVQESKHKVFEVAERAQVGKDEACAENPTSNLDQTQAQETPELAVKSTERSSVPKNFLVY
jgi:hypothetical protein